MHKTMSLLRSSPNITTSAPQVPKNSPSPQIPKTPGGPAFALSMASNEIDSKQMN